jgi:hypothetical protein
MMKPYDRFDLEQEIMNCWHVTNDIDSVAKFVGEVELDPKDQDAILNMLLGMKQLYEVKFQTMFEVFEALVHAGELNAKSKKFKWDVPEHWDHEPVI